MPIPDGISDEHAAAVLLKGLTAWYLLRRSYPVKADLQTTLESVDSIARSAELREALNNISLAMKEASVLMV